ncbi:MAG TPA: sulfatase [Solirubrobacteraceae bacterium]
MRIAVALLIVAGVALGGLALVSAAQSPQTARAAVAHRRPNIVFILTDDLSWNLINRRFTPHIVALQRGGETFSHYFVADSLCCPSRSTIFTGLFPHDTKVVTNLPPKGGFQKFQSQGLDKKTYAVAVRRRGYATSMMGKYLNGYGDPSMTKATAPIPPGWSDWHVSNSTGYAEFNYLLNDNGKVNSYGGPSGGCHVNRKPDNYGVDMLNADARSFIKRSRRKPFAIEVATFAPHAPYTPAPRNACDFPGLTEPRDPSFDANNINPPAWLGLRKPLRRKQLAVIERGFRMRAQAVESVDKLVADVEATLAADHLSRNTYIVFSSDNGYHMGQHRLTWGKQTAFDTDIRVPLIVAGPGVPRGKVVSQVTQNVDLYPTFLQLAGATVSKRVEGRSLVALLHPSKTRPPWRRVALVEHHGRDTNPQDPDFGDGRHGGDPTTYEAIRISARHLRGFKGPVEAVYVEYQDPGHELEYYDIGKDPSERDNIASRLNRTQKGELHRILAGLERCHSGAACWKAGSPS